MTEGVTGYPSAPGYFKLSYLTVSLYFSALTCSILPPCANAARALTFFQSRKKVSKEALLRAHFLSRVFSRLEGEEKTAGRKCYWDSVLSPHILWSQAWWDKIERY